MKTFQIVRLVCAGMLTATIFPDGAYAQGASFDLSSAGAAGSGCELNRDAFLALDEDGNLELSLSRFDTNRLNPGDLAGRLACSLRVPMEIPSGHYVYQLTYSFWYDLRKSESTEGSVGSTGTVFGIENPPMIERFAKGTDVHGAFNYSHVLRVPQDQQCAHGLTKGMLQLTLITGYQKDAADEHFHLAIPKNEPAKVRVETLPCD
jgi:hypothetical protein